MSVQDEIDRISAALANVYAVLEGFGATMPDEQISDNLAATAATVPVTGLVVTTEGSGSAYTASVPGLTELKTGAQFVMIPHTASTSNTATLNVNGLGAKYIRQRLSTNTSITVAPSAGWIVSGKPVLVTYNGTQWVVELTRPDANNLYGTVPITSGGTGATDAATALANLGAAPAYTYGTDDLTAGESELATGTLYFVYE